MESATAARRAWRVWGWSGVGMTALVACLMIAPAASATSWTVVKAPWTGATVSPSHSTYSVPCAHAVITTQPQFYWMSGIARTSMWAAAAQCSSSSASYGDAASSMTVTVPLTLSSGTYHVMANWKVVAYLQASYSAPTSCPVATATGNGTNYSACDASAYAYLELYSYIEDTTNNSYVFGTPYYFFNYASAYDYNASYCNGSNCSYYQTNSSGTSMSVYLNKTETSVMHSTFVGTHTYELVSFLYAAADTSVSGFASGHASAVVNMATAGHHALLASVVIT